MNKTKNLSLLTLSASSLLLFISGCAAPVLIGDGKIEKPLTDVTGLRSEDVEKTSRKAEMNLWDVYTLAVERTESLASKVENIEQAEAQGQQAIGSILPQISLNGSKGWSSNAGGSGGSLSSYAGVPSESLYLSGTENLLTGLNQVAALQGAEAQTDQNHQLLRQGSRDLLLAVARAFYSALQAGETLQSKQEIQKFTEQILKQEQQWKTIGRSRESDVLATEAQLTQLEGDMENARNQMIQAHENLLVLANVKSDQLLKSEETAQPPSLSLAEAEARVDQRADVRAAKAAVDLSDAGLLQAHGQHLPSLGVQGKYYLDNNGSASNDWNVQLVASLPLFEGGSVLAQERSASSKKRQAEMQYALARRQALADIRESYQSLTSSLKQVDAYAKALEAAKRQYAAVEHDRKLALNTNLDVLQSLTALQNAENNYNQAHYQSLINSIWVGVATGELPKTEKTKP